MGRKYKENYIIKKTETEQQRCQVFNIKKTNLLDIAQN